MTAELNSTEAALDVWREERVFEASTPEPKPIRPSVQDVIVATCLLERVEVPNIVGPSRQVEFAHPRQLAMYVARSITGQSYPKIGRIMGGRDHTTVLYATRKWAARVMFNEADCQRARTVCRLAYELAEEKAKRSAAQMEWIRKAQASPALVDPSGQMVTA